jgi:hypothetical protein
MKPSGAEMARLQLCLGASGWSGKRTAMLVSPLHANAITLPLALVASVALSANAQAKTSKPPTPTNREAAGVVENEREFADMASDGALQRAFRTYAAPSGLIFGKDPQNARRANSGDARDASRLSWEPTAVGVAVSDDLAFDIGPWTLVDGHSVTHGWFMTVWQKQSGGKWQFVADNGIEVGAGASANAGTPVIVHPIRVQLVGTIAMQQVVALEATFANGANGIVARLTPRSWVLRDNREAATGPDAVELVKLDGATSYMPLGGTASRAGDVVFTYGRAIWPKHFGFYLRVWCYTAGGWHVIMDQRAAS